MKQPIITISEMMELSKRNETLPDGWWKDYKNELWRSWTDLYHKGKRSRKQMDMLRAELSGDKCPVCGKPMNHISKSINFGTHHLGEMDYWEFSCSCEDEQQKEAENDIKIKKGLDSADIPAAYTDIEWNSWDDRVDPILTKSFKKVESFSSGDRLKGLLNTGLVLFGEVGRGKTMSGICLIKSIIRNSKKKCLYIPMADLTRRIIHSGKEGDYIDRLEKLDVIFLDDLDKLSTASDWVQERIFSLFDTIFRENKCLILTTNLMSIPAMQDYFGDNGEAIISRMSDKMEFIGFKGGEDYRKKRRAERLRNK